MKSLKNIASKFAKEEDGAAMIEYTVLLGLIAAAVILMVIAVGGWILQEWTAFNGALPRG